MVYVPVDQRTVAVVSVLFLPSLSSAICSCSSENCCYRFCTVSTIVNFAMKVLSIGNNKSEQTVQTLIRKEQSDQHLHCLQFTLQLLVMVKQHYSNFRVITAFIKNVPRTSMLKA